MGAALFRFPASVPEGAGVLLSPATAAYARYWFIKRACFLLLSCSLLLQFANVADSREKVRSGCSPSDGSLQMVLVHRKDLCHSYRQKRVEFKTKCFTGISIFSDVQELSL